MSCPHILDYVKQTGVETRIAQGDKAVSLLNEGRGVIAPLVLKFTARWGERSVLRTNRFEY